VAPAPIETSTIAPPGNATVSLTSYGYDESGNQVSATDGNGREAPRDPMGVWLATGTREE